MDKVYVWGTGMLTQSYLASGELEQEELLGFIESKPARRSFQDKRVFMPEEIVGTEYDYIFVLVGLYAREILNRCNALRIPEEKLIFVNNYEWTDGTSMRTMPESCCRSILKTHSSIFESGKYPALQGMIEGHKRLTERYGIISRNEKDFMEQNTLMRTAEFALYEYQHDYYRFRTFELMADEIICRNVQGACAELGVFKGSFAEMINVKFPDRKLFLFDTFESFDDKEFESERDKNRCSADFQAAFKDTDADRVLNRMQYPKQCVIKQGLFPRSAVGCEEERFAFVSIDVDLEQSTLAGLRFFYPRLSRGGAIFLHDYNSSLGGVKYAVDLYEKEVGEPLMKVPLADACGTLVIVK